MLEAAKAAAAAACCFAVVLVVMIVIEFDFDDIIVNVVFWFRLGGTEIGFAVSLRGFGVLFLGHLQS